MRSENIVLTFLLYQRSIKSFLIKIILFYIKFIIDFQSNIEYI